MVLRSTSENLPDNKECQTCHKMLPLSKYYVRRTYYSKFCKRCDNKKRYNKLGYISLFKRRWAKLSDDDKKRFIDMIKAEKRNAYIKQEFDINTHTLNAFINYIK